MKKTFLTLFILFSINTFAQQNFDLIKSLDSNKIDGVLYKIKRINSSKEEIKKLKLFLEDPFNTTIVDFNIIESIKILDKEHEQVSSSIEVGTGNKNLLSIEKNYANISNNILKDIVSTTSSVSSGFSPTTQIIDATSKLLVDRTKQELTLTFYENFKSTFNNPIIIKIDSDTIHLKLKKFFRNTHNLFESQNYFQTPSFGQVWTTSFKKDIQSLPSSFRTIINENEKIKKTNQGHFAVVSFDVLDQINKGFHPRDVLKNISLSYKYNPFYQANEVDKLIGLLDVLSNNLTTINKIEDEKIENWVSSADLKKLDDNQKKLIAGLIFQKLRDEKIIDGSEIQNIKYNYKNLFNLITKTQSSFSLIENKLIELKNLDEKEKEKELQKFSEYLNFFYDVFNESYENYYTLILNKDYYASDYYKNYLPLVNNIIDFNTAINTKNYAECILISSQFMTNLIPTITNENKLVKNMNFYGNFMLDVLQIQ